MSAPNCPVPGPPKPGGWHLVMPIRIAVSEVAAWEIVLAVALTAAGAWTMTRLGGRLYRGALLRIGPKVRLRDAWRASG